MIAYLEGVVKFVEDDSIILSVNGVGYRVYLIQGDLQNCAEGQKKAFFIESIIREDAFDLYGFSVKSGQEIFVKLRSVKGVGSKTALSILQLGSMEVMEAITAQDVKFLSKAHGLGKKGAERIILELQNTLPSTLNLSRKHSPISDNIMTGLIGLGYTQKQVKEVLSSLPKNVQKEEDVVKFFLQNV
jgi:Holliday junction DNA helicase RuvA